MIDQMKEYGDISFTMLYNSTPDTSIPSTNNETLRHVMLHGQHYDSKSKTEMNDELDFTQDESNDISKFAIEHRLGFNMDHTNHLLIAIAWVIDREVQLSCYYHSVIKVDCTSGVCNED